MASPGCWELGELELHDRAVLGKHGVPDRLCIEAAGQ